jgi:heptosyltransferase-2
LLKSVDDSSVRKILIRSVNWVGDAVMTTPAIGVIRRHFPNSEITILANPLVAPLFSPHDSVDRVMVFDRTGRHSGIIGRFRLAAELRSESFDMAVILPNSFDSALVPWLAGIPVRLGKSSDGRALLLTESYNPGRDVVISHEVNYYLDLLGHFGFYGKSGAPQLFTAPDEERGASRMLAGQGIAAGDFVIGINPGAAFGSAKRWYPDRFAEVARQLAAEWEARIIIFGGPAETGIAADIERSIDGACLNLAGKTGMRELMSLIRRCNFFVTNDSGPMHIAAAFGVPTVAVFGPTDHATTSPFTDRAVIVRRETDCAPCKLRECPTDHRCMTAVTAEDVLQAARKLMVEPAASGGDR